LIVGQMTQVLSIGHSTLGFEQFSARLKAAGVTAVADVRSSPFSRNFPQYNRDVLKEALAQYGITYVFLGKELGGRPRDQEYYTNGIADYERMATADSFRAGLDRIEQGARKYRLAIMCSERSPLDCHRCLLIGRALAERGLTVDHIDADGRIVGQQDIERQLLTLAAKHEDDMFATPTERLNDAYRIRARKVAFAESQSTPATILAE